jgi:hypothetical protein
MSNRIVVIDPSTGGKDNFTFCTVGWETKKGRLVLRFADMDAFGPQEVRKLGGAGVMAQIIAMGVSKGARFFCSDQRDKLTTEDAFRRAGVRFSIYDWTAASKPQAVERVRAWLRELTLALPRHEALRRELVAFEEKITPAGSFTFNARSGGHDDYVALLITAAMADMDGQLLKPGESGPYEGPSPPLIPMRGGFFDSSYGGSPPMPFAPNLAPAAASPGALPGMNIAPDIAASLAAQLAAQFNQGGGHGGGFFGSGSGF